MQLEVFKRQLRRVFKRGNELTRAFLGNDLSRKSLISTPAFGSSATRYIATSEPNGLAFCAARYTAPSSGSGSNGDLICTVPTFEASGQNGSPDRG